MTTNVELKEILKKQVPLPLDWLIATNQEVTQEKLDAAKNAQRYQNREKIEERFLWMADLYNELTGQEPTSRSFTDWASTFEDWKQEGLQPEHIRAAWVSSNDEKGGFFVGRPGALTVVALSIKSKTTKSAVPQINAEAIEKTKQMLAEKWDGEFVPVPQSVLDESRARVKARLAQIDSERGAR